MGLLDIILTPWTLILLPIYLALYYIPPYFFQYRYLARVPGPFAAKFSNIWLALQARKGQKYASVDAAHRKYGKIVRVGYNHVSLADERALITVYGHGNGFLKDHFYEAFVSGVPGVFNTRDRVDHTRKRKIVAHAFSPKSVGAFETHMASNLYRWVGQLDRLASYPTKNGFAEINAMPWCSYLAFDIIGDLAFGKPFGMVEKGRDESEIQLEPGAPISYAPAVDILNRRGEVSSTLGLVLPFKPYAKYFPDPFFTKGLESVRNLHGMAVAAVATRLDAAEKGLPNLDDKGNERVDLLTRLLAGKDANGNKMGRDELISEALTQLIAGSDTISNTACAVIYWTLHGERAKPGSIIPKLQKELDAAIPGGTAVPTFESVRHLPYLKRCIDESMRLHSTSSIGLPRIVADGPGVDFDGVHFPPGTVLSVPSYTIHHDADIWGKDVEEFNPDRWLNLTERQKTAFNPFSYGPRACVGRNVAEMELALIIGCAFRRYEWTLYTKKLESHEGFSKKPKECFVGIKMRNA